MEEVVIEMGSIEEDHMLFDRKRWKPNSEAFLSQLLPSLKKLSILSSARYREGRIVYPDHDRNVIFQARESIALSKTPNLFIEVDYFLRYTSFDQALLSLNELEISCAGMDLKALMWFRGSCPNLRSLTYHGRSGPDESHYMAGTQIKVWDIIGQLDSYREVLESLSIDFDRRNEKEVVKVVTIADMRHFSRLTNLKVDAESLFELERFDTSAWDEAAEIKFIDKLPGTIENLTISRADERHLNELKHLARVKPKDFPKLNLLMLELWSGEVTRPLMYLDVDLLIVEVKLEWSWESPSGHYYQPFPIP